MNIDEAAAVFTPVKQFMRTATDELGAKHLPLRYEVT